jgi:hypothetical protein
MMSERSEHVFSCLAEGFQASHLSLSHRWPPTHWQPVLLMALLHCGMGNKKKMMIL